MYVVSAAPLLPRSSLSTWTISSIAFTELVLDAAATAAFPFAVVGGVAAASAFQVLARDLLEGQEAVAVGAVVDEARFEAGLDAGDDRLVDVALALLLARGLDVEVDQLLAVDDCHPELLGLGGVEQHALHGFFPARIRARLAAFERRRARCAG